MFKVIKIKHPDDKVFAVSDLHIGHDKNFIYEKRGFTSAQDHDHNVIGVFNKTCNHESIVINIGDFVFNDAKGERFKSLCRQLNFGIMYLLIGNHTSGHKRIYTDALKAQFPDAIAADGQVKYEIYPLEYLVDNNPDKKIVFLPQYTEFVINNKQFVFCHYPIISHNDQANGSFMICGHSHGSCEFTNTKTGSGYRLDVGIESFEKPISIVEIRNFFQNRTITSFDHHGKKYETTNH